METAEISVAVEDGHLAGTTSKEINYYTYGRDFVRSGSKATR
jgi:hypothetical protein